MAVTAPDSLQQETTNRYTLVKAFYLENKVMAIVFYPYPQELKCRHADRLDMRDP